MSKAVLISIHPEWCEKIVSGEKTIEVRKTRPKMQAPFKCYIYCTNPRHYVDSRHWLSYPAEPLWITANKDVKSNQERGDGDCILLNGKVIGEFVCDRIQKTFEPAGGLVDVIDCKRSCLTAREIISYAGGKALHFWHISDLVIYDNPKELSEFEGLQKTRFGYAPYKITRPPQSFCYVEELA